MSINYTALEAEAAKLEASRWGVTSLRYTFLNSPVDYWDIGFFINHEAVQNFKDGIFGGLSTDQKYVVEYLLKPAASISYLNRYKTDVDYRVSFSDVSSF